MQLTTLARVKTWSPMSATSTQFDGLIRGQIAAVSSRLEAYLRRHIQIQLRTEDYFVDVDARRFHLRAAPLYSTATSPIVVAAAPTLVYSPDRTFTETAEDVLNYYVRLEDGLVEFDYPINYDCYRSPGAFRAAYYGGLAFSLDQLVASSTSHVGAVLTVGATVTGSLSGAVGTVLAITSDTSITVQVLSGSFQVGENFVSGADSAAFSAQSTYGFPLCMQYPELVEACNAQVSWWFQRREQMGLNTMSVEGATISMEKSLTLLKGVQETVEHLVRYGVTY